MSETDDQLARRLLGSVLDGELKWTPDMRLRIATVAQAYASLAILEELRRLNDRGDAFTVELLSFFERLTEDPQPGPEGDGSPRSGQPAAAPVCPVCGKASTAKECWQGQLTREQWIAHYGAWTRQFIEDGCDFIRARADAQAEMEDRFGPCPEES